MIGSARPVAQFYLRRQIRPLLLGFQLTTSNAATNDAEFFGHRSSGIRRFSVDRSDNTQEYASEIKACSEHGDYETAMQLFQSLGKPGTDTMETMISVLCKSGNPAEARNLFDEIVQRGKMIERPVLDNLVRAYTLNGEVNEAIKLLKQGGISYDIKSPATTYEAALVDLLLEANSYDDVNTIVSEIEMSLIDVNSTVLTCILHAHGKFDRPTEAYRLFRDMIPKYKVKPSLSNYNKMINILGKGNLLEDAVAVFDEISPTAGIAPNIDTFHEVIKAHGRCGDVSGAYKIFQSMSTQHNMAPNVVTYNLVVDVLAGGGELGEIQALMAEMKARGLWIDGQTYNTILGACLYHNQPETAVALYNSYESSILFSSGRLIRRALELAEAGEGKRARVGESRQGGDRASKTEGSPLDRLKASLRVKLDEIEGKK